MKRRIATVAELVARMRTGSILTKSYGRGGPTFEVRGQPCDARIVDQAISDGFLRPLDPGLFDGPAHAQTFQLIRSSR
jgi:hypothetical protein